jgi:hypothetical protein
MYPFNQPAFLNAFCFSYNNDEAGAFASLRPELWWPDRSGL